MFGWLLPDHQTWLVVTRKVLMLKGHFLMFSCMDHVCNRKYALKRTLCNYNQGWRFSLWLQYCRQKCISCTLRDNMDIPSGEEVCPAYSQQYCHKTWFQCRSLSDIHSCFGILIPSAQSLFKRLSKKTCKKNKPTILAKRVLRPRWTKKKPALLEMKWETYWSFSERVVK